MPPPSEGSKSRWRMGAPKLDLVSVSGLYLMVTRKLEYFAVQIEFREDPNTNRTALFGEVSGKPAKLLGGPYDLEDLLGDEIFWYIGPFNVPLQVKTAIQVASNEKEKEGRGKDRLPDVEPVPEGSS